MDHNKKSGSVLFVKSYFLIVLFCSLCFSCADRNTDSIRVSGLKCDYRENPMGVESSIPRLSWVLLSSERNKKQSAYQILVASSPENMDKGIADILDSRKVKSDQSFQVPAEGIKLESFTRYYWKVRIWDENNKVSEWSEPAYWETGLLRAEDWAEARWIGYRALPDSMRMIPGVGMPLGEQKRSEEDRAKERTVVPCFRKEFTISRQIERASLFISGLGQYEATINGDKAGPAFLSPGWTRYEKSVLYNCYDVTNLLKDGMNAIGVMVGNGFYYINSERYAKLITAYGEPSLICQLRLVYADGTTETIVTDQSWKCTPSPVTYSSIYGGEDYDARMEQAGWNKPEFDDSSWQDALLIEPPSGRLKAEHDYPVAVMEKIDVKKITPLPTGGFLYDFGQNASGIPELKVKGKRGQQIRLIPGELITEENLVNQDASGKPFYFTYTLKGDDVETWKPRFTYYGFRYVQVEGAVPDSSGSERDLPRITGLTMLHTRNSSPATGSFECSYELFNQTNELIKWAIKSNLQSVVTDCPHREKLGWLEQTYLMGASLHYNFNLYHLYRKQVQDMMESQTDQGLIPGFTPEYKQSSGGFRDSPEWGSASVILPWMLYRWYGDTLVMREAWPMMCRYVDYLKSKSDNHILSHGLGDWFDLGPKNPGPSQLTPIAATATAIYYYDLVLLSKMAGLLNKKNDKTYYSTMAEEVKKAYNGAFYNAETGVYATGSQTAMAMPWVVGLADEEDKKLIIENLADSIRAYGKPLTAGDVGFHYLVRALTEGGQSQLLYEMNARNDVPGYGYQLKKGATSLTESWPALESVSNNHLMLGHLMEWFFAGLGGIKQEDHSTGFKEIIIQPEMTEGITFSKVSYHSPYGKISCEWAKRQEKTILSVVIPVNTTARVFIPALPGNRITESGKETGQVKEIKNSEKTDNRQIYCIGSGSYLFEIAN